MTTAVAHKYFFKFGCDSQDLFLKMNLMQHQNDRTYCSLILTTVIYQKYVYSYNRAYWREGVLPFSHSPWKTCRLHLEF